MTAARQQPAAPTWSTAPAANDPVGVLQALAAVLAPLVARELAAAAQPVVAPAEPYNSRDALPPGMSRRTFLEHARAGDFPSSKRGRVVFVQRADFEAWVASGARRGPPAPEPSVRSIVDAVKQRGGPRRG